MMDEELDVWYEDSFDFDSDTAQCGLCGHWYCRCCGCDCWMNDSEDDYYEEVQDEADDTENYVEWIVTLKEGSTWSWAFLNTETVEPVFILESYGDWTSVTADEITLISKEEQ